MNYRELQKALKIARNAGLTTIKLNQKKEILQAEYNRIINRPINSKTEEKKQLSLQQWLEVQKTKIGGEYSKEFPKTDPLFKNSVERAIYTCAATYANPYLHYDVYGGARAMRGWHKKQLLQIVSGGSDEQLEQLLFDLQDIWLGESGYRVLLDDCSDEQKQLMQARIDEYSAI